MVRRAHRTFAPIGGLGKRVAIINCNKFYVVDNLMGGFGELGMDSDTEERVKMTVADARARGRGRAGVYLGRHSRDPFVITLRVQYEQQIQYKWPPI